MKVAVREPKKKASRAVGSTVCTCLDLPSSSTLAGQAGHLAAEEFKAG